jgi:hypothetical protein
VAVVEQSDDVGPTYAETPFDVLAGQDWERALFGTFTLSLAFFDTLIVPPLQERFCEQIHVLVDVRGNRSSLQERGAVGPGKNYELIPVNVRDGIFHPKFAYLWSREDNEDDVLLVGSGNLTFGGYGRNVEVFEVLQESTAPLAFDDFAGFLGALLKRSDLDTPRPSVIGDTLGRLQKRARRRASLPRTAVRLLHSVNAPILNQFLPIAKRSMPVKELVVWSPYHHPAA